LRTTRDPVAATRRDVDISEDEGSERESEQNVLSNQVDRVEGTRGREYENMVSNLL